MPRALAASILVVVMEAAAGLVLSEPALLGSAALTAAFAVILVGAEALLRLGHERRVAPMLAASVFLLGLVSAILIPGAANSSSLLPILSAVLVIPGRARRTVAAILGVAIAGSVVALLMGGIPHALPPMREPLGSVFESATLLGVAVLIMGGLTDFAIQARESVDGLHEAVRSHDAASAEHAAITISLGRIERKDTIEATANEIVTALRRLPDIELAGVYTSNGADLEILGLAAPVSFPLQQGDSLPAGRARHILDRSREGPWAERWVNDPSFGAYGAAFTASGIKGQAYAPFFESGALIGVVGIGTSSEDHAEHLLAHLPAVSEFAATASLLLTPMLIERRAMSVARAAIEAIISERAFRPVFQPIVELATGSIVGFEALTRFVDGRRPDLVFACADRAGVGLALELHTLDAAVAAARDLPEAAFLSLNVSPELVLESTGLVRLLSGHDRPVVLEITEHVAIDDYRAVRCAVETLGGDVRVAVDDAGAGIANFSHLVELRPTVVKVDAGLIRDLDVDLARQAAVVGLVHFAAKAGCMVIAEGIETEAERATAQSLGVTHGQGFLMARPARVGTFATQAPSPALPLKGGIHWRPAAS